MTFIGQAEVSIDAKSRLAIPAKFRAIADAEALGSTWVCMPREGSLLWLMPRPTFLRLAGPWGRSLIPDDDTAALQRALASLAEPVEMDSAGRITIPRRHLELTGLRGDVVVAGAMSHLEVHSRGAWQELEPQQLARLPGLIAKMAARGGAEGL